METRAKRERKEIDACASQFMEIVNDQEKNPQEIEIARRDEKERLCWVRSCS